MITQEHIKELLDYDPVTGILTWRVARGNLKAGSVAGTKDYQGYIRVSYNEKRYRAQRLIWLLVYGEWPDNEIDHINGIKDDNRLVNLRDATRSQQEINKPLQSNNTSGFKGVVWNRKDRRWQAQISLGGKFRYLGQFNTPEEANAAYIKAAGDLHGEFANSGHAAMGETD